MANICKYKCIVKGKKNSCYALLGSMPTMEVIDIYEKDGTEELFTIRFEGECRWSVDCYRKAWRGKFPVVLPKDSDKAFEKAEEKYSHITLQDRTKMFDCEVWCNSVDIEDRDSEEDLEHIFVHYKQGKLVKGKCPDKIKFRKIEDPWDDGEFIWV